MEFTLNDFEAPGQETVEIAVRGKTAKYIIMEVSGSTINDLFSPINSETDPVRKAKAAKDSIGRVIAACVLREDGSKITVKEAEGFRFAVQKKLQAVIAEVNGLNDEAEDKAKKE